MINADKNEKMNDTENKQKKIKQEEYPYIFTSMPKNVPTNILQILRH